MIYKKRSGIGGVWLKGSDVVSGVQAKLVSEVHQTEGEFGMQDAAKIRIKGDDEIKNVRVNKPSIGALVEAFGEDSKEWVGKLLTLHTEKMVVAGKRVTALYLLPEGFELKEDDGGYLVIVRADGMNPPGSSTIPVIEDDEDIDVKDIPF